MQGIKVQFDASSIAELKQKFNQYVNDLSRVGNVSLKVDTESLSKIKGNIDQIRNEFEKLGKVKIIPESFDNNGQLQKFTVQLEQIDGLMQKIAFKSNEFQDIGNGNLKPIGYGTTGITQTNNTAEYLAKQKQLESESLALYEADEKKKEQLSNEEYNKKMQLEQEWTNTFNKNAIIREQKAKEEQEQLVNTMANGREKSESNTNADNSNSKIAQAKAVNKALEEQYQEKLKIEDANRKIIEQEEKRVSGLGTKLGSNLNYDSSTKDIEKYLKNNVSLKAQLTSVSEAEDSLGNSVKKCNYTINEGNGFTHKYQMTMDSTSNSTYNLSKNIENHLHQ